MNRHLFPCTYSIQTTTLAAVVAPQLAVSATAPPQPVDRLAVAYTQLEDKTGVAT